MNFELNIKSVISVILIIFLSLIIISHFFKGWFKPLKISFRPSGAEFKSLSVNDQEEYKSAGADSILHWFKLNPFYRNKILLEGFEMDASGNAMNETSTTPSASDSAKEPVIPSSAPSTSTPATSAPATSAPATSTPATSAPATSAPATTATTTPTTTATPATATTTSASTDSAMDTEKATIVADLFEKVNTQMDIIRTIRLSDKFVPINIDKTASEPFVILMNLKLLINNGIYKNEMDLRELYDKYMGNKAIQVLTSDINSVNMDSRMQNIGTLETSFLSRCQSIVDGHQKIIDKILENKSKESV